MARVKLSEYDAKRLLLPSFGQIFSGFSATPVTTVKELTTHFGETNLVVKVDQGVKKRGKRGLIRVNCTVKDVINAIKIWSPQWSHFFVEPVIEHGENAEHYLAIERIRDGWQISYSHKGGIDIESTWDQVQHTLVALRGQTLTELSNPTNIFNGREGQTINGSLQLLIPALEKYHVVFLEMNPILIRNEKLVPLDMAAEIDSAALSLSDFNNARIIPLEDKGKSVAEHQIAELDSSTPASLKFHLVNPKGHIWMLLSGGGASLVLADEVNDHGMGNELANYGEYSGAPTDDDVYAYTKIILTQLLQPALPAGRSTIHDPQAIIIAGGVANFTDVGKTFKGIIRAMDEVKTELVKAKVRVFVRRGGPNEAKGLAMMEKFLKESNLFGSVHGHDIPLTRVVSETKEYLTPKGYYDSNSRH